MPPTALQRKWERWTKYNFIGITMFLNDFNLGAFDYVNPAIFHNPLKKMP